jgi:hypothetical protein
MSLPPVPSAELSILIRVLEQVFSLQLPEGNDIFISKLNSSGNFVWAKRLGGTRNDIGYAVTVDAAENVFTTGSFSATADFDPGTSNFNMTVAGSNDIFISKLDASGNFVWARRMGGTGSETGFGIQLDYAGNVYTTGDFHNTADFDPGAGTANLVSAGFNDSLSPNWMPSEITSGLRAWEVPAMTPVAALLLMRSR